MLVIDLQVASLATPKAQAHLPAPVTRTESVDAIAHLPVEWSLWEVTV